MFLIKMLVLVGSLVQPVSIDRNALEVQTYSFHKPTFAQQSTEITRLTTRAIECMTNVVVTDARFQPDLSGALLNKVITERGESCIEQMREMYDRYLEYFGQRNADEYFDKVFLDFLPGEVQKRIKTYRGS